MSSKRSSSVWATKSLETFGIQDTSLSAETIISAGGGGAMKGLSLIAVNRLRCLIDGRTALNRVIRLSHRKSKGTDMNQTAGMLREIIRLQEAFLYALEDMLDEIEGDVEDEEDYDEEGEDAESQGIALLQGR